MRGLETGANTGNGTGLMQTDSDGTGAAGGGAKRKKKEEEEDGGGAYVGCLDWKNDRMDNCAGGVLVEGSDMAGA